MLLHFQKRDWNRLGPEIVESVRDFQSNFKTNCKLISDLPSFRLSEVVRWPAFRCARCHPSASEWTWRSGVQVHVQSECTLKGRTFGAGRTGTAKHRSIPSQWQPGRAATGSILWSSVSQWVSPCETEIVRKSKKFYRRVNNIKFSTVTFLCEMQIRWKSAEAVAEGLYWHRLARFWGSVLMIRWIQCEGTKLHNLNCIQFEAAEPDRQAVHEQSLCRFSNRRSQPLQISVRRYLRTASGMKSNRLHTGFMARIAVVEWWFQKARPNDASAGQASILHKHGLSVIWHL